jgi:hypothetical protein
MKACEASSQVLLAVVDDDTLAEIAAHHAMWQPANNDVSKGAEGYALLVTVAEQRPANTIIRKHGP